MRVKNTSGETVLDRVMSHVGVIHRHLSNDSRSPKDVGHDVVLNSLKSEHGRDSVHKLLKAHLPKTAKDAKGRQVKISASQRDKDAAMTDFLIHSLPDVMNRSQLTAKLKESGLVDGRKNYVGKSEEAVRTAIDNGLASYQQQKLAALQSAKRNAVLSRIMSGDMSDVQQLVNKRSAILHRGMMTMEKAGTNMAQGMQMTSQSMHFSPHGILLNQTVSLTPFEKAKLAQALPELFGMKATDDSVVQFFSSTCNIGRAIEVLSNLLGKSKAIDILKNVAKSARLTSVGNMLGERSESNGLRSAIQRGSTDEAKVDYLSWINGTGTGSSSDPNDFLRSWRGPFGS